MSEARRHLECLAAEPRPAGGAAEARARAHCAAVLESHGFSISEEPFAYSAVPGRWGTPVAGAASMLTLLLGSLLAAYGHPGGAVTLLVAAAVALTMAGMWLARRGVLHLPLLRAHGVNLVAARGDPHCWLVAHLDSKSQPVPIAARALGVMMSIGLWVLALGVAVYALMVDDVPGVWPWIAAGGLLAGLPVVSGVVGTRSAGAVDDASGVATVLRVVQRLDRGFPVGVLLTSGEELGLAGARAWVEGRQAACAVNVDGVDDHGPLRLTYTRRRPRQLIAALESAARATRLDARTASLVPGVLLDGVALADAGWEVLTVSRGTWRTAARVHTARDDLTRLSGTGVEEVAEVLTRAFEERL